MTTRLASTAEQVLAAAGIDAMASLTGGPNVGTLTLTDPGVYSMAESQLRRAGMGCTRRTAATMDVFLPEKAKRKLQDNDEDTTDFDSLVSSWREFAKRSSDAGYRKAGKEISPGYNPIAAARQIADATLKLSKRSPLLRKIARALQAAARTRDIPAIKRLLSRLTAGPGRDKPIIRDPKNIIRPDDGEESVDLFASPVGSIRQADPKSSAFSSAQQFLLNHAHEQKLTAAQVSRLKSNPGEVFEGWRQSTNDKLKGSVVDSAWVDAADAVAGMLRKESKRASGFYMGEENGVDEVLDMGYEDYSNHGFLTSSALDVPYDSQQIKSIVGRIIEHFVVDEDSGEPQHPSQITTAQVRSYLRKNAPDAPLKPVISYLDKVTNRIPNRHDERKKTDAKASGRKVVQTSRRADPQKKLDTAQPLQAVINQFVSAFQKKVDTLGPKNPQIAKAIQVNYDQIKFKWGQQAADFFKKKADQLVQNSVSYITKKQSVGASRLVNPILRQGRLIRKGNRSLRGV